MIGFCNHKKTVCAFKFVDIIGDVKIEPENFKIPDDYNVVDHLENAWGININTEITIVKLRFEMKVIRTVLTNHLLPSQIIDKNRITVLSRLKSGIVCISELDTRLG